MEITKYSSLGTELNIPAALLIGAGLDAGAELSVLSADGMLIIAATEPEHQRELTDELSCFMEELGFDPEEIYSVAESGDCGGDYDGSDNDDDDSDE
jgi:antitoxin component of MazEF toxin-antitoxin module